MHFVTCTLKSTILICGSPWICLTFGAAWRAGRRACECIGTSSVIQFSVGDCAVSKHVFRTLWVGNHQESFVSPRLYNVCLFFPLLLYQCNSTRAISLFGEGKKASRHDGLLQCTLVEGEGGKIQIKLFVISLLHAGHDVVPTPGKARR